MSTKSSDWDLVITPHRGWLELHLDGIWQYRDLLWIFIKRNIVTQYKQTILGPFWLFIQPVITTIVFTVIFGNIAQLSTDGLPKPLFYLSGVVAWNYFSTCFTGTSNSLSGNAGLFGKVYFPRIIAPLATVVSSLVRFFIQFILFLGLLVYYIKITGYTQLSLNAFHILYFPLLILIMGFMGLGFGLVLSSLTVKYRDLRYLMSFGVRLLMYASPVIFPLSMVPEKYLPILLANPMTSVIEAFRSMTLGQGSFDLPGLAYSVFFTISLLFVGLLLFNRIEKNFIDSV